MFGKTHFMSIAHHIHVVTFLGNRPRFKNFVELLNFNMENR